MSVVIKMDMPESCKRCGLYCIGGHSYSNAYCGKTKTLILDDKKRNNDCPIISELPEKHGRLIDADDFLKFLQALTNHGAPYESVIELLKKHETIIEAEGNENDIECKTDLPHSERNF